MKDAGQKDNLYAHFTGRGWYAQIEVPVHYKGGTQEQSKIITDIDVLALRPSHDLSWDVVLGDCRTLKSQSPANRAIWLRGIMVHFSAASGIAILRPKLSIEPDHKLFASSLSVTLLSEQEFEIFDRAILYPFGASHFAKQTNWLRELMSLPTSFPRLQTFCSYIYGGAWNETDLTGVLRRVIGEAQTISTELDPKRREHLALVLDAIGVFAVAAAHCVGIIFRQYLQPTSKDQLDDALKFLIWGGREKYNFFAKLRRELLEARGQQPSQSGSLSLSAWDRFAHLIRTMLENPLLAFRLPQALRQSAINLIQGNRVLVHFGQDDLLLLKYGMLATAYFCRASGFPAEVGKHLEDLFIKRQSELLHEPTSLATGKSELWAFRTPMGDHEDSPHSISSERQIILPAPERGDKE